MSYPPLSPQGIVWAAVWGVVLSCCIWRPQISLSDRPPAVTDKTFGMQTVDHRVLAMCHTWRVVVTMYPKDWTSSKLSVTLVEPFTFAAAPSYGKTNSADWHLASGSYWHIHHRWQYRNHLWSSFFVPPPPHILAQISTLISSGVTLWGMKRARSFLSWRSGHHFRFHSSFVLFKQLYQSRRAAGLFLSLSFHSSRL